MSGGHPERVIQEAVRRGGAEETPKMLLVTRVHIQALSNRFGHFCLRVFILCFSSSFGFWLHSLCTYVLFRVSSNEVAIM